MRGHTNVGRDIEKEYRAMTLHVSITDLAPSRLWILRYICRLIGATLIVCKKKVRKEEVA